MPAAGEGQLGLEYSTDTKKLGQEPQATTSPESWVPRPRRQPALQPAATQHSPEHDGGHRQTARKSHMAVGKDLAALSMAACHRDGELEPCDEPGHPVHCSAHGLLHHLWGGRALLSTSHLLHRPPPPPPPSPFPSIASLPPPPPSPSSLLPTPLRLHPPLLPPPPTSFSRCSFSATAHGHGHRGPRRGYMQRGIMCSMTNRKLGEGRA